MGLALCHRVPRDFVIELALWLMIVAFVLQAVAIGSRNSITSVGYLSNKAIKPNQRVAWIAAHPALYSSGGGVTVKICNPSESVIRYDCARFAETYHVVNGLILASFITNILVIIAGLLFFTAFSNTSTGMLRRLCVGVTIPTTLQCAVCGLFFARTVHYAKKDVSVFLTNVPANELAFHRRYAANVMIAATAFLCAAEILVVGRFLYTLLIRWRVATSPTPNCTDVQEMMRLHLINDDWERQKQILRSHAKSVQLEICIKENNGGHGGTAVGSSTSMDSSAMHNAYGSIPSAITRTDQDAHENLNNAINDTVAGGDVHNNVPNELAITPVIHANETPVHELNTRQTNDMSLHDSSKAEATRANIAMNNTEHINSSNVVSSNMVNLSHNIINYEESNILTGDERMCTNDLLLYSEESAHNNNTTSNSANNIINKNAGTGDDSNSKSNNNSNSNSRMVNVVNNSGVAHQARSADRKVRSGKQLHKHASKSVSHKKWDEVSEFSFRRQTPSFVLSEPSTVTVDGTNVRREVLQSTSAPTNVSRSSQRVLLVTSAEMADSVFTNHN